MNIEKKITKLPPEPHQAMIERYGREGASMPGDDDRNPWVPFGDAAAIKHFSFDVRTNTSATIRNTARRTGWRSTGTCSSDPLPDTPFSAMACLQTPRAATPRRTDRLSRGEP